MHCGVCGQDLVEVVTLLEDEEEEKAPCKAVLEESVEDKVEVLGMLLRVGTGGFVGWVDVVESSL